MKISEIGRGPAQPIPPEIETVEGFLRMITDKHEVFYHENPTKQFNPLLMVLCENGEIFPIMPQWDSEAEKQVFCLQMQVAFKLWRVKSYVFAMEAWLSSAAVQHINEDGSIDEGKNASEQPDRKEVIFTIAVDKTNKVQKCLEIKRDYLGHPHLVDFPEMDGTDFAGRFANLLNNGNDFQSIRRP